MNAELFHDNLTASIHIEWRCMVFAAILCPWEQGHPRCSLYIHHVLSPNSDRYSVWRRHWLHSVSFLSCCLSILYSRSYLDIQFDKWYGLVLQRAAIRPWSRVKGVSTASKCAFHCVKLEKSATLFYLKKPLSATLALACWRLVSVHIPQSYDNVIIER